jgi:hypothetical protein
MIDKPTLRGIDEVMREHKAQKRAMHPEQK